MESNIENIRMEANVYENQTSVFIVNCVKMPKPHWVYLCGDVYKFTRDHVRYAKIRFKQCLGTLSKINHISKVIIRRHFQKIVLVRFSSERAVWTVLPRWTFIQLCQGELRRAATFFAPFFVQSCDQYSFVSFLLCYKRISSWFSCASIELWMHLGSTWEAKVALGYRLEQLLRFPRALQTSRVHP